MNAKQQKKQESFYRLTDKRRSVHVRLPDAVREGFRERSKLTGKWQTELWDEAARKFVAKARVPGSVFYEHPARRARWAIVWIDTALMQQLQKLAERDEMSMARVVHTALARYLGTPRTR